ncbi:unnamed protein product [Linum tenue]|uniref:Cytochrome P450 n=1 Tax=Linum tenue TaxID=586396 RepID=A0AAV0IDK1_9ROSI|nr:unnamed protein product [Linum tenue]
MPSGNIIFYDARDILFSPSDGAHWRRMRKICAMELLGERRVKSLRPIREEEVGKMVKFIRNQSRDTIFVLAVVATKYGGGMVNLSELLIAAASTMVSRAAFGKIRELEGSFLTLAHRVVQAMGGFSVGDIFPSRRLLRLITGTERKLRKLHEEGDMILQEIIDEHLCRRSTGTRRETYDEGEDLVDVLLNCTDDHVEVKAVILDMFLAGGDSSPGVVEWAMSELMKNPKEMEKVQREMRRVFDKKGKVVDEACFGELHYLKLIVKETFRLHPPVPLSIPREGREKVVIDGYQVPTKTRVIINMWAINRDPSHWTQPDQFLPERFLDTSIDYKESQKQRVNSNDHEMIISLITSNPLILLLILFLTLLLILKSHLKPNNSTFPLPPGPWKLPIIGNIHQLAFSSNSALIHHRFAELAKQYGPVMHLQLGETSNVLLSSPEATREYLKTHDHNFSYKSYTPSASIIFYGGRDIAFSPEGEYWRRMRRICTSELLTEKRVRSLRPIREAEVGKLMRSIRGRSEKLRSEPNSTSGSAADSVGGGGRAVNLSQLLISMSRAMTSRTAFGRIRELEGGFLPLMRRITEQLGGLSTGDIFPSHRWLHRITGTERQLKKLHKEADAMLQGIIDEHLAKRSGGMEGEDLVDVLLRCTEDHIEVKAVILDIFLAGGDPSPTIIEWIMAELMKNPKEMEKVQIEVRGVFDGKGGVVDEDYFDELHYFKAVVNETFRLHPPAALSLPRESPEMVVIGGYQIPTKTRVIVNMWALGRDPSHWTQPDQFMPERFLNTPLDYKRNDFKFIPFGAGRRSCPGMNYAIATVYLILANLLYHFDWKLLNQIQPQKLDMSEEFGATVERKNNLYLIPTPYNAP